MAKPLNADERQALSADSRLPVTKDAGPVKTVSFRAQVWAFLEAQTPGGQIYQRFTVFLIVANVVTFVLGTVYDNQYNVNPITGQFKGPTWHWGDVMFFGVNTYFPCSILEIFSVIVFTIDYILRVWAVVEAKEYNYSRQTYIVSFFALVDLISILPFYVDLMTPNTDIPASQFFRMFRLFRMMKVQGRYSEAFQLFDDALFNNKQLLATAGFVGAVVWIISAGFYYIAERKNLDMVYCPQCPNVDTSSCVIDEWGIVDCTRAQCHSDCWNLFESIPMSMYNTGINLFGEFPLTARQSNPGKVIAVFVAVVAVVIFGIPTGILGDAFTTVLKEKKQKKAEAASLAADADSQSSYGAVEVASWAVTAEETLLLVDNFQTRCYSILFGNTTAAKVFEHFVFFLIITSTVAFFFGTWAPAVDNTLVANFLLGYEIFTMAIFTVEYILRLYCCGVDPKYAGLQGKLEYMWTFQALIDIISIVPFYISLVIGGRFGMFFRVLRLVRLFKTERYMEAFTIFDDVLMAQMDLFVVGGFVALVFWIFFSSLMYFTERTNLDPDIRQYYLTIPDSMWITLLNLSGECPLAYYSAPGQVIQIIMGIFAVGVVGIPIGILGAGFQDWVEDHKKDTPDAPDAPQEAALEATAAGETNSKSFREHVRDFADGKTSLGQWFEYFVLFLIFATIATTIIGTLPGLHCEAESAISGWCDVFYVIEVIAAIVFTLEWFINIYAASSALGFIFSFYSFIDVAAVLPFWLAILFPGSWIARHDSYFIILRIMRLFKLDKYIPSMTLIDDAVRLKWNQLVVTVIVASILWILFAALLYSTESSDTMRDIDAIPQQGCGANCTEAVRYDSAFAALPFALIHLTGDYPIIEYSVATYIICFFMVVIAVGLFGIPAGLLADGFVTILQEKEGEGSTDGSWEVRRRALEGTSPENKGWMDECAIQVNLLLNGKKNAKGRVKRTPLSKVLNTFILTIIVASIAAIILESVPSINRTFGRGFQAFEVFCVIVFTVEYALRLFSASKDVEHLYSRWYYATTFFGIVDLLTVLPWYIEMIMYAQGNEGNDCSAAFRAIRLFRLFELEHFVTAFTILDNVFRRSKGILLAASVMAFAIWVGASSLFYLFEYDNPNWCAEWTDPRCDTEYRSSCMCSRRIYFNSIPDSMYMTAVFLGGEWAAVDFTLPGKLLCMILCLVGIAIYAVPVGTLFEGFGNVLSAGGDLKALEEDDDD